MATTPAFTNTFHIGVATVTSATTDKTGATTTNIVDAITGVAAGTQVFRLRWAADGNLGDGTLLVWIHNGTAYKLFDDIDVGDPAASSNTVAGFTFEKAYNDLYLPSTSWKIGVGATVIT